MSEILITKKLTGPKLNLKEGTINLTHGSGGRAMAQLIEQLFLTAFDNEWLAQKNDQACFIVPSGRMVMATDSHVISPLFFLAGILVLCQCMERLMMWLCQGQNLYI